MAIGEKLVSRPKFSAEARNVIQSAMHEGLSLRPDLLYPEDLFYMLLKKGYVTPLSSVAYPEITAEVFITGLERSFGQELTTVSGKNSLDETTKVAIRNAIEFAQREGVTEITPYHLVKGVLIHCYLMHPEDGDGFVETLLTNLEVNYSELLEDTGTLPHDEIVKRFNRLDSLHIDPTARDIYKHYNKPYHD